MKWVFFMQFSGLPEFVLISNKQSLIITLNLKKREKYTDTRHAEHFHISILMKKVYFELRWVFSHNSNCFINNFHRFVVFNKVNQWFQFFEWLLTIWRKVQQIFWDDVFKNGWIFYGNKNFWILSYSNFRKLHWNGVFTNIE